MTLKTKFLLVIRCMVFTKMFLSLYVCSFVLWLCSFSNPGIKSMSLPLESGLGHGICLSQWGISKCEANRRCISSCTTMSFSLSCWDPFHLNMNKLGLSSYRLGNMWRDISAIPHDHFSHLHVYRYTCMRPS